MDYRLKRIYILDELFHNSDENHLLSTNDLIRVLATKDIRAERKTIYQDIDALRDFGADIIHVGGKKGGYFMASREFEIAELKLLVDAVVSSRFITQKKSQQLIGKLGRLTSNMQAWKLNREIQVIGRVKSENENIYYNVDHLHEAISLRRQVSFQYFSYNLMKERDYRKNGQLYIQSPVSLVWNDENYYVVMYSEKHQDFTHYRVDRMANITILEDCIVDIPQEDMTMRQNRIFSMFTGKTEHVHLRFDANLINVVLDRYGLDLEIKPYRNGTQFDIEVDADISKPFFGWLASFQTGVRIIEPAAVVEQYYDFIQSILTNYQGQEEKENATTIHHDVINL